jgi:hypothetical protein
MKRKKKKRKKIFFYNGRINPDVRIGGTVNETGESRGWMMGIGNDDDLGFGAGQRLKFVVLPLNALMFRENFASGAAAAEAVAQDTQKAAEGFKDIL